MLCNSIKDLIGNTPLYKANNIMKYFGLKGNLYLKLERFNATGSSKDRLAYEIIKTNLDNNVINKDTYILEATSGNTGISIASICTSLGLKCIIVMPSNMSKERISFIEALGGKVVLSDASLGMKGSIEVLDKLKKGYKNHFVLDQFNNELGILAHYKTTGVEIYNDLDGKVDYFISPIGTGTTFTGTSKYLKEKNSNIKCIGVEAKDSNLLNGGKANTHLIQGISANFIPSVLDRSLLDYVYDCSNSDSYYYCNKIAKLEGILCGISSGASLACCIDLMKKDECIGKNIVAILPDSGERYMSTGVFNGEFK